MGEESFGAGVIAVVEPSMGCSRISLRQDGVEVACLSGTGVAADVLPMLLRLADASFDVDEWLVEVGGFQRVVLEMPSVVATAVLLGIELRPLAPTAAGS